MVHEKGEAMTDNNANAELLDLLRKAVDLGVLVDLDEDTDLEIKLGVIYAELQSSGKASLFESGETKVSNARETLERLIAGS